MPALGTVTFASTHADSFPSTSNNAGVFYLKAPTPNAEVLAAATGTIVDLHQTVSIPVGYIGLIANHTHTTLTGANHSCTLPQVLVGTGSPVALTVNVYNISAATPAITANTTIATLNIIKNRNYSHIVVQGY